MTVYIPCQNCHKEYSSDWRWYICDKCGFRICPSCLSYHKGKYGNGFVVNVHLDTLNKNNIL